jgi:hypothetical protein
MNSSQPISTNSAQARARQRELVIDKLATLTGAPGWIGLLSATD